MCSDSTLTIGQAEAKPKSTASTKGSSILIAIDKTTQKMSVFINGTKKYAWRVSTGRPGYSTPSGTYTATSMNEVWYSKEWDNAPMPHAIFFMTDGHAVHGSYESFAAPTREGGLPMDFKKFYFSPEGRVNRKQWWLWLVLPFTVISILLGFVDMATGNFDPEAGIGLFSGIFALLSLIPAIIVHIKRFHDRDKSGWWVLIGLVPIIGAIWLLIELGFLKGIPGPNRFGPPVTDGARRERAWG